MDSLESFDRAIAVASRIVGSITDRQLTLPTPGPDEPGDDQHEQQHAAGDDDEGGLATHFARSAEASSRALGTRT